MKYKSKNKYFQMPIKIDVHMRKQLIKTRKKKHVLFGFEIRNAYLVK